MQEERKKHWENVYTQKQPTEVSWYQTNPGKSLELIALTGVDRSGQIIDIGGGASVLVDQLLDQVHEHLTVLDISAKAIEYAKERLGDRAEKVNWIVSDITEFKPSVVYDLWHDRAVFHFLTDTGDRRKYVDVMSKALHAGSHVIISAFSLEGPAKCSGLDVERYDADKMAREFGDSFELVKALDEAHITPWKAEQKFIYCYFRKSKKEISENERN